jgi:AraC-like DNA-binding protein
VSQRYLSDILKALTSKTMQQHIHLVLIEKARILLNQNALTTAEITYRLRLEHLQSFNNYLSNALRFRLYSCGAIISTKMEKGLG